MKKYTLNIALLSLDVSTDRKLCKLNQRDYAKKAGLSHTTLSRIENGTTIPDLTSYALICHYLDVDMLRYLTLSYEKDQV